MCDGERCALEPCDMRLRRIAFEYGCTLDVYSAYTSNADWHGRTVHVTRDGRTVLFCARTDALRMSEEKFRRVLARSA